MSAVGIAVTRPLDEDADRVVGDADGEPVEEVLRVAFDVEGFERDGGIG